jgi:dephospho-CoA kinase
MKQKKRCVIGLTGGIATGKTTMGFVFKKLGAHVICCDTIAHNALRKNSGTYKKIVRTFGEKVLKNKKKIDRARLGSIVFSNGQQRKKLENIIHPYVFERLAETIKRKRGIIIIDVPLLFETGFEKNVDLTIVVCCSQREQINRLLKRNMLKKEDARARIAAQMPLREKKKKADFIIENTHLKDAVRTAQQIYKQIQREVQ